MTATIRAVYAPRLLTCSMNGSKEVGLPGRQKDSQVSSTSKAPIFTMRCSLAVKVVHVNYDIVVSCVMAHL